MRGLALYMASHVAVRLRTSGSLGHGRPIATVVLLALIPVATIVPALVALALAAAVCATLIAYEAIRYRYAAPGSGATAATSRWRRSPASRRIRAERPSIRIRPERPFTE